MYDVKQNLNQNKIDIGNVKGKNLQKQNYKFQ